MNKNVNLICARLKAVGHQAFLVGGCVRDHLRGVEPKDFDITTDASPAEVKKIFADFSVTGVGEAFGITVVVINGEPFEIAQFRKDVKCDGRHAIIEAVSNIEFDLARRDFTMNAIAMDPTTGRIRDPFDGKFDIDSRVIDFVGIARERIMEDSLRILRAFRFMSQLDFTIAPDSLKAIREMTASGIWMQTLSQERITSEFGKILTGQNAFETVKLMAEMDILFQIMPELLPLLKPHNNQFHTEVMEPFGNSIFAHTMFVLKFIDRKNLVLGLAALLHDVGKPATRGVKPDGTNNFHQHDIVGAKLAKDILTRMKFPNEVIDSVCALTAGHMNLHDGPKMRKVSSIRRLLGRKDIDLLVALGKADTLGTAGQNGVPNHVEVEILTKFVEDNMKKFPTMLPDPIINGTDLILEGAKPGPNFKRALDVAFNLQLNGTTDKKRLVNHAMSFIKTTSK